MGLKKRMRLAREALLAQTAAYEKDHGIRDFEFGTKEQREEAGPIRAGFHRLAQDEMIAGRLIQKKRSASFWLHYRKCLFPDGAEEDESRILVVSVYLRSLTLRFLRHDNISPEEARGEVIQEIFQRMKEIAGK